MTNHSRLPRVALLIAILMAAFGLRLYHLSVQSMWYDEIITANSIRLNLIDPAWSDGRSFFHVLLTVPFGVLIPNEFGYRWLSVIAGTLAAAVAFQAGRGIAGTMSGLACALALAIIPFFVYYGQEARGYAFVSLFSLLSLWLALKSDRTARWMNITYPVFTGVLVLLHLYAVPWLLLQIGLVALRRRISRQGMPWRAIFAAAASTVFATGLVLALELYKGEGVVNIPKFAPVDPVASLQIFAANVFGFRLFGYGEIPDPAMQALLIGFVCLTLFGMLQMLTRPGYRWHMIMLTGLVLLPLGVLIAAAQFIIPIWQVRYAVPMLTTGVILVSSSFVALRPRWLGATALMVMTISALILTSALFRRPRYQRDDWRTAVGYIVSELEPGDQIYTCSGFPAQGLVYYAPDLDFYRIGKKTSNHPIDKQFVDAVPTSVRRAWVIGAASDCTFKQAGVDAPGFSKPTKPGGPFHHVTVRLYERRPDGQ